MKDLSLLSWKEIKETDKGKSIVFVVMAPLEEHGWHLPIGTDLIEGDYWSKGAMEYIENTENVNCFYLPPFPIAAASVTEFYGSIHYTMKTTYQVAYGILDSLRCMEFENIIIIASHADPRHLIAVEKAVRKINRKYGTCAFAPMGQIYMGEGIHKYQEVNEFENNHKNDFHAGWIETSNMLAINQSLVREIYQNLPDSEISDRDMISNKKQLKAMGEYGYLGEPQYSTSELGRKLNEECIESIADATIKFYNRNGYQKYEHYNLYNILPLHIGFIETFGKVKRKKVSK